MESGIFVLQDNGELVEMKGQSYDSEALLQSLLGRYPRLLAGDQIDAGVPRRWLLVSTELPLPGEQDGADCFYVDNLFLDQDAVPTFVEVKQSTNPDIPRKAVGQMLEYAANAVAFCPVDRLRATFEATCRAEGRDPEEALQEFLSPEADADAFWESAKTNLRAGKVRMVLVADRIPTTLQVIIEFLNRQMSPAEVLAVEIRQYAGQGL